MTRERVALLFATSGHSGVDRVVANLLPEFARSEHVFDLLTIRGHGPRITDLPTNVRHMPLPARHRNTALPSLVAYLRRERPRALLTASHRLNRAVILARMLSRVPVHVTLRMGMSLTGLASDLGPIESRRLFRSMRRWYPRAEAVIAPSAGVGRDLREFAGVSAERLHVIPNPVVDAGLEQAATAPLDDPWFDAGEPPVILGAGSLEPRKDFATLLRAFAELRGRRNCRLIILGEGRQRRALEMLARELGVGEDVRLPGHEANPHAWMARAAVFALTSRREGSGAVLVEALACGTPAVATDCPSGPAETLQQGRVGPLVAIGDSAGLAAAIEQLLDAPPDASELRAAAEPFRVERAAARYLAAMGLMTAAGGQAA